MEWAILSGNCQSEIALPCTHLFESETLQSQFFKLERKYRRFIAIMPRIFVQKQNKTYSFFLVLISPAKLQFNICIIFVVRKHSNLN